MVLEFVKPARFSRKIFVGGLPNGISEHELFANFHRFGYAHIDWPHKSYNDLLPPSGFAFIIFEDSAIVERIMQSCTVRDNKYMFVVKMVSGMSKEVELKAWELKNNELILASNWHDFERLTIFVGGLPRTITATELAKHLQEAVGGVAYVRIEVDETTEYPKGSARVVLCARESYVRAIAMRDFAVVSGGMERQAEIKPYIHHKMPCEGCGIQLSAGFCSNIRCLKYFCDNCWRVKHSAPGMGSHRPMQKSRYLHQSKKSSNHTADEHLRFSMSVPSSDTPYWLNTATDLSPAWLSASNLEHLKMAPAWSSSPKLGNTESSPFWLKSPNLDELDKITSKLAPIFSSSPSFANSGQEAPWPKSHSLEDLDNIPNWPALSPFGSSDQSTEESSFMNWRDFKKNLEQFDGYDSGYVTSSAEASPFSESVFDFASKYPF